MRRITRFLATSPWLILIGLAIAAPVAGQDADHNLERCGTDAEPFVCGQIGVELTPDASIEEVVERLGGNPDTDILRACATSYCWLVAVERGTEEAAVERYSADPDVTSATLREWRDEYALPSTAMSGPGDFVWVRVAAATCLIGLVGVAGSAWRHYHDPSIKRTAIDSQ